MQPPVGVDAQCQSIILSEVFSLVYRLEDGKKACRAVSTIVSYARS